MADKDEQPVIPLLFKACESLPLAVSTQVALQTSLEPLLEEDPSGAYAKLHAALSGVALRAHRSRLVSILACTCKAAKALADGDEPSADASAMRRAVESQAASLLEAATLLAANPDLLTHAVAARLAALCENDPTDSAPQLECDEEPAHEAWDRLTQRLAQAVEADVDDAAMGHQAHLAAGQKSLSPRSMSDLVARIKRERVLAALRDYV